MSLNIPGSFPCCWGRWWGRRFLVTVTWDKLWLRSRFFRQMCSRATRHSFRLFSRWLGECQRPRGAWEEAMVRMDPARPSLSSHLGTNLRSGVCLWLGWWCVEMPRKLETWGDFHSTLPTAGLFSRTFLMSSCTVSFLPEFPDLKCPLHPHGRRETGLQFSAKQTEVVIILSLHPPGLSSPHTSVP